MADIELKVLVKGEASDEEVTDSIIKALQSKKKSSVSKEQFTDDAMISVASDLQGLFAKQYNAMLDDIEKALDQYAEELEGE